MLISVIADRNLHPTLSYIYAELRPLSTENAWIGRLKEEFRMSPFWVPYHTTNYNGVGYSGKDFLKFVTDKYSDVLEPNAEVVT
jgi:hypothetical protein